MPGQSLLKATLLKETYGPFINLNGAERNHAGRDLPSRFSIADIRFLDLITPKAFPDKELQKLQQFAPPDAGFRTKDLINVYEKLTADANKSKPNRRVAIVGENFPPKSSSNNVDSDHSARLSCSPAEALSRYRSLIFQEAVREVDERSQTVPSSDDWEYPTGGKSPTAYQRLKRTQCTGQLTLRIAGGAASGEQPSLLRIETSHQAKVQTVRHDTKHATAANGHDEHLNKSSSTNSEKAGLTGVRIEAQYAISSGSSKFSNCDQEKSNARDYSHHSVDMSSEMCRERRSTPESTGKTLYWQQFSKSSVSNGITSRILSRSCVESKAIDNPDGEMAMVISPTVDTKGLAAGIAKQLQAYEGPDGTAEEKPSKENCATGLSRQYMPPHMPQQSLIELSDGNLEDISNSIENYNEGPRLNYLEHMGMFGKTGSTKARTASTAAQVAARQELSGGGSEASDSDRTSSSKSHAEIPSQRLRRSQTTEDKQWDLTLFPESNRCSNQTLARSSERLRRSRTVKESTMRTAPKKWDQTTDLLFKRSSERLPRSKMMNTVSTGPQECSQMSSTKSHDCSHQPFERSSELHRRVQTMDTPRTIPEQDVPGVSERFGKSRSTTERALNSRQSTRHSSHDLCEVSKRLGRSQSTTERTVLAAWASSYDDSFPTLAVLTGVPSGTSRNPAEPSIATKTMQKLQKLLGKGMQLQPVADTDTERANSVAKAQQSKSDRTTDGLMHDGSSMIQLSHEKLGTISTPNPEISQRTGRMSSLVSAEYSNLESNTGLSPLLRKLKNILGFRKGEVRIDVASAQLHGIAEKKGDKTESHPSSRQPPVEGYKSLVRERGFRFTGSPKRSSSQRPLPRRTSARSPRSFAMRRLSPKQNADYGRYRKSNALVGENELRRGPIPRSVSRDAGIKTEEANMISSGSRIRTAMGQPPLWTEDSKATELWRHSIPARRQLPRSTSSRFRHEYIATQRASARPSNVEGD